jgi:hypothetical protein
MNSIFMRVHSHRAGDRLKFRLNRDIKWYQTWETGGCLILVTETEAAAIKANPIKGVTRYRGKKQPAPCWSMVK